MLVLSRRLVDEVIRHAREEHPLEACGIIAGKTSPERIIRMENVEESDTRFAFSDSEWLRVREEMDFAGEQPFVLYHSHTGKGDQQDAHPSDRDRRFLYVVGYEVIHLIAGTKDPLVTELRAYRFLPAFSTRGRADVEEVELRITDMELLQS